MRGLLELADKFASAALDSSLWTPALEALADFTHSSHGQLIGIGSTAAVPFNWVTGFPESALEDFDSIDGGSPLVNPRVAVAIHAPILQLCAEEDYRAARPMLTTDIYADFSQQYRIQHGCQTKLFEGPDGIVGLAVLRSEQDGQTSELDRAMFGQIAPFVRSAVRTQMALENAGAGLLGGALDALGAAVFVCDARGAVAAMTDAAEGILRDGRLRLVDGHLCPSHPQDVGRFKESFERHFKGTRSLFETVVLGVRPGSMPLVIDICAAPRGPWHFSFRPQALVIVRTGQRWHVHAPRILQLCYQLSPAEADVALQLARGQSREAIAARRGSSLATVRAQLKSAFAKLGIGREVELAAMLGRMAQL